MGSFEPPRGAYQSEDIAVLQKAFDEIWSSVVTHHPSHADDPKFKTVISEKLCALAEAGITDPDQLRSMTLASLQLS